jgi:hypothetical protein
LDEEGKGLLTQNKRVCPRRSRHKPVSNQFSAA